MEIVIIEVKGGFDKTELSEYTQFDPALIETIEIMKENLLLSGTKFKQIHNILIADNGIVYCALYTDFLRDHVYVDSHNFDPPSLN
jgi:hypothetical protein